MKRKTILFISILQLLVITGCYDDLGNYAYTNSTKVSFVNSASSDYTFMVGDLFEMDAPINFSTDIGNVDELFTVQWYLNRELIYTGYHLKYQFEKGGTYELILKVINKETNETYISNKYTLTGKNSFDWGWMILSDKGDGKSALSFINPAFRVTHNVESTIEGGLGTDPRGIYYYYVLGSISGSYVSGLPKVLINQGSGSVTLDGNSLQKDMWLADEFENRKEPDDLKIMDFAFKEEYYVICSEQGEVYIRTVGSDNKAIPYYGKYGAMPYEFEGGSRITCFAPFHNVTYWCADEERCILYDEQNARFIGIAHYSQWGAVYTPAIVYFKTYDQDLEVPSGVLRVNDMGAGTRCLAIGAYEKIDVASNGGLTFWANYVSLIDVQGTGNYNLHEFAVKGMDNNSHLITGTDQYGFSGGSLLTPQSIIKMSSNFEKNPYFYFTDGDKNLYVYSMQMRNHVLAYTADSRITGISGSPIVCEFYGYGGNSTDPNFRLALSQENGNITVIDVNKSQMVRLFEGFSPDLKLQTFTGFGNVKGMVWCTNYEGEY